MAFVAQCHGFDNILEHCRGVGLQSQSIYKFHFLPIGTDGLCQGHLEQGDAVRDFLAVELALILLHLQLELVGGHGQARFDGSRKVFVQGVQKSVELV